MWKITDNIIGQSIVLQHSRDYKHFAELPYRFRMLDDDGEVYFVGSSDDDSSEEAFAPLDCYGMPAYGCTEIQYLNYKTKNWETL